MQKRRRAVAIRAIVLALVILASTRTCFAFSVLAHQALVDSCWKDSIVPALRERFPAAGEPELQEARSYAYGGSHIADLGYFPFGSRLFTDLVHYVESGHF